MRGCAGRRQASRRVIAVRCRIAAALRSPQIDLDLLYKSQIYQLNIQRLLNISNHFKGQILLPFQDFGDILPRTMQPVSHTLLGEVLFFHVGQ